MTRIEGAARESGVGTSAGSTPDYEAVYATAAGDRTKVPWDDGRPNPLLVAWLDTKANDLVRPGARVIVVGCGLGHDARELARRGYDVTAFDVSGTAVEWARTLDPEWADVFCVADLFDLPSRWRRRFDLVVEVNTMQALPPSTRGGSLGAIESLLHPHGTLLLVARGADRPQQVDDGPPWALTTEELRDLAARTGLVLAEPLEVTTDSESPAHRRICATLKRANAR